MNSLQELGMIIQNVRDAINQIEAKGERNASIIVYSVKNLNDLIASINKALTDNASKGDEPDEHDSNAT